MNVVVAVSVVVIGGFVANAFAAPKDSEVARTVAANVGLDLHDRLVKDTQPFIDAPYLLSPLGEGAGVDADPRIRFDAFDCTTFVETALALVLATDLDDAKVILDHIRYRRGEPSYAGRRHFPEAEWIPELTRAGLLEDITRDVGGDSVTRETKKLNAAIWHNARHEGLPALDDARIPDGVFALDVWPLDEAAAHPEKIPVGTLLHLVRVDFPSVPVRVSHQALVIERDGQRFIRHAADRMHHRVVDEPIDRFFSRMKQYGKWPVRGVHLTRINPKANWRPGLGLPPASPTPTAPLAPPAP